MLNIHNNILYTTDDCVGNSIELAYENTENILLTIILLVLYDVQYWSTF